MKKLLLFSVMLIVLFGAGCHKTPPEVTTTQPCSSLDTLKANDSMNAATSDPFCIKKDSVVGDDLKLTVSCCDGNNFKLVWNQYSMAPFTVIQLQHNTTINNCKQAVDHSLCFDISLLKKRSGLAHGSQQFPLSDHCGKTVTVKYNY